MFKTSLSIERPLSRLTPEMLIEGKKGLKPAHRLGQIQVSGCLTPKILETAKHQLRHVTPASSRAMGIEPRLLDERQIAHIHLPAILERRGIEVAARFRGVRANDPQVPRLLEPERNPLRDAAPETQGIQPRLRVNQHPSLSKEKVAHLNQVKSALTRKVGFVLAGIAAAVFAVLGFALFVSGIILAPLAPPLLILLPFAGVIIGGMGCGGFGLLANAIEPKEWKSIPVKMA